LRSRQISICSRNNNYGRNGNDGVIAKLRLAMDKNEIKGRALRPADTAAMAEAALVEALGTGKVGALTVDPHYLVLRSQQRMFLPAFSLLLLLSFFANFFAYDRISQLKNALFHSQTCYVPFTEFPYPRPFNHPANYSDDPTIIKI
jgi:hypothetical protein